MKRIHRVYYEEERLYCDKCGEDISDDCDSSKVETLYKTTMVAGIYRHQDIIGKKFKCLKCGQEHIEDEYNNYPVMYKRYE